MPYANLVFRQTPKWATVAPDKGVLRAFLGASDGRQEWQTSLAAGIAQWADTEEPRIFGLGTEAVERKGRVGAYAKRTMVSQPASRKQTGRAIVWMHERDLQAMSDRSFSTFATLLKPGKRWRNRTRTWLSSTLAIFCRLACPTKIAWRLRLPQGCTPKLHFKAALRGPFASTECMKCSTMFHNRPSTKPPGPQPQ